jgi:hypothetical protein
MSRDACETSDGWRRRDAAISVSVLGQVKPRVRA